MPCIKISCCIWRFQCIIILLIYFEMTLFGFSFYYSFFRLCILYKFFIFFSLRILLIQNWVILLFLRQLFIVRDGGTIALDWLFASDGKLHTRHEVLVSSCVLFPFSFWISMYFAINLNFKVVFFRILFSKISFTII